MITQVIKHINGKLSELNFFDSLFGICEIISDEKYTFPAYYKNKKYNSVIDFKSSQVYHRLLNDISIVNEQSEISGCSESSEKTYSLRMVLFFDKDKCYESFETEEKLISTIEKKIVSSNDKEISDTINAEYVHIYLNSVIIDRNKLSRDEFNNSQKIDFNKCFIAINYEVKILKEIACNEEIDC
jgi:hypothetical protein